MPWKRSRDVEQWTVVPCPISWSTASSSPPETEPQCRGKHELDWERETEISRGYYTTVYRETERKTGVVRAVKEIRKTRDFDFKPEVIALERLAKPAYTEHFGRFLGWWETEATISFAFEYFEHGDLRKFLGEPWTEYDSRDIATQLLSGLFVMHNDGFAHRDLKPENILIVHTKPFLRIKIGDFGVTKRVEDKTILRTKLRTKHYLSPEVLDLLDDDLIECTGAVDIWAVGVIIFETLTASKPFSDSTLLKKYCEGRKPFPTSSLESKKVSMEGIVLLESFLESHPRDRPTADTAMRSAWFEPASAAPRWKANEKEYAISKVTEELGQLQTDHRSLPQELEKVHLHVPHGCRATDEHTSTRNSGLCSSHKLVTLRKDPRTPNEEKVSWKVDLSAPSGPAREALISTMQQKSKHSLWKHYQDLDLYCKMTIERVRADWIKGEQHPNVEWVISSIEEEESTTKPEPASNEVEVVHVLLQQQQKLKFQSLVPNNHNEPGLNGPSVKGPGSNELGVDYCIAPCSWGIARSVPFDATKHCYNQRYWHPIVKAWCVSNIEWMILKGDQISSKHTFKTDLFDELYFSRRFELTGTIELINMILLTSSSREPSGLKEPVVELSPFGVPQYIAVDIDCRTLTWSVSDQFTTMLSGDPELALQLIKSTLTVIMEMHHGDPPRYITPGNDAAGELKVTMIPTPKVLWLY